MKLETFKDTYCKDKQSLKEICKELDITYIDKNIASGFILALLKSWRLKK